MTTPIQGQGDFNLFALELLTKDSIFDLREVFVEINLFEDLFAPSLSGDVTVDDARNLTYYGPILGGEILNIGINTPTLQNESEGIQTELEVYSMPHKAFVKDRVQQFVISGSSPVAIQNMRSRVNKSFEDTHANIIQEIFEEYLNIDNIETLDIEQDKYKEKVIIPNWRPLNAIQWLAGRSVSGSDATDYLFYQTRDGFQFKSLSSLLSAPKTATISLEKGGLQKFNEQPINRITVAGFEKVFNRMDDLKKGMFGSTLVTYDQTRKKIEKTVFDYVDEWNNRSHAEKQKTVYDEQPDSSESQLFYKSKRQHLYGAGQSDEEHDDNVKEYFQRRNSFIQDQNRYRFVVTITGNANIKLGDIIKLDIPSPEMVIDSVDNQLDGHLSGRWLVTSIRHKITRSEHMMTLDLMKDSFKEKLLVGGRPTISTGTEAGTFF